MKRRILCLLLSALMVLTALPLMAFMTFANTEEPAEETKTLEGRYDDYKYLYYDDGHLMSFVNLSGITEDQIATGVSAGNLSKIAEAKSAEADPLNPDDFTNYKTFIKGSVWGYYSKQTDNSHWYIKIIGGQNAGKYYMLHTVANSNDCSAVNSSNSEDIQWNLQPPISVADGFVTLKGSVRSAYSDVGIRFTRAFTPNEIVGDYSKSGDMTVGKFKTETSTWFAWDDTLTVPDAYINLDEQNKAFTLEFVSVNSQTPALELALGKIASINKTYSGSGNTYEDTPITDESLWQEYLTSKAKYPFKNAVDASAGTDLANPLVGNGSTSFDGNLLWIANTHNEGITNAYLGTRQQSQSNQYWNGTALNKRYMVSRLNDGVGLGEGVHMALSVTKRTADVWYALASAPTVPVEEMTVDKMLIRTKSLTNGVVTSSNDSEELYEVPVNDRIYHLAKYGHFPDYKQSFLTGAMLTDGLTLKHYFLRTYDVDLTEEQMMRNHFADLCYYYNLDMSAISGYGEDVFALSEDADVYYKAVMSNLYSIFADYQVGVVDAEGVIALQNAIDTCELAYTKNDVTGYVYNQYADLYYDDGHLMAFVDLTRVTDKKIVDNSTGTLGEVDLANAQVILGANSKWGLRASENSYHYYTRILGGKLKDQWYMLSTAVHRDSTTNASSQKYPGAIPYYNQTDRLWVENGFVKFASIPFAYSSDIDETGIMVARSYTAAQALALNKLDTTTELTAADYRYLDTSSANAQMAFSYETVMVNGYNDGLDEAVAEQHGVISKIVYNNEELDRSLWKDYLLSAPGSFGAGVAQIHANLGIRYTYSTTYGIRNTAVMINNSRDEKMETMAPSALGFTGYYLRNASADQKVYSTVTPVRVPEGLGQSYHTVVTATGLMKDEYYILGGEVDSENNIIGGARYEYKSPKLLMVHKHMTTDGAVYSTDDASIHTELKNYPYDGMYLYKETKGATKELTGNAFTSAYYQHMLPYTSSKILKTNVSDANTMQIYFFRAYDVALTNEQMLQNHFADLCYYYEVDLDAVGYGKLTTDKARAELYEKLAKEKVDAKVSTYTSNAKDNTLTDGQVAIAVGKTDKATLEARITNIINEVDAKENASIELISESGIADAIKTLGFQARTNANVGVRSIFTYNYAAAQALADAGYTVTLSAYLAIDGEKLEGSEIAVDKFFASDEAADHLKDGEDTHSVFAITLDYIKGGIGVGDYTNIQKYNEQKFSYVVELAVAGEYVTETYTTVATSALGSEVSLKMIMDYYSDATKYAQAEQFKLTSAYEAYNAAVNPAT